MGDPDLVFEQLDTLATPKAMGSRKGTALTAAPVWSVAVHRARADANGRITHLDAPFGDNDEAPPLARTAELAQRHVGSLNLLLAGTAMAIDAWLPAVPIDGGMVHGSRSCMQMGTGAHAMRAPLRFHIDVAFRD